MDRTAAPTDRTPRRRHQAVACLQAAAYYAQAKNSDALANALHCFARVCNGQDCSTSTGVFQAVACLQAAAYYAQAKNSDALADALYRLEDFEGLEQLTAALPEGSPLLLQMGEQFQSVGLCQQAAAAYIKVTPSTAILLSCLQPSTALLSSPSSSGVQQTCLRSHSGAETH